ncbi:MAG: 1,4-dihydroxy-6-naphthoate synthase, partial [Bacteroidetes bacterium]|nr:1,4-dihydroxy-6-naphthoate synthase [Bacteroidota bacterium]
KRELSHEDIKKINDLIRQSIEYARSHPEESKTFVAQHSQSMDEDVRQRHIDLYVNDFTLGLGEEGRKAVETLFEIAEKEGVVPKRERALFE